MLKPPQRSIKICVGNQCSSPFFSLLSSTEAYIGRGHPSAMARNGRTPLHWQCGGVPPFLGRAATAPGSITSPHALPVNKHHVTASATSLLSQH